MNKTILMLVLGAAFLSALSGCVTNDSFDSGPVVATCSTASDCRCPGRLHKVFLVSSQGSQWASPSDKYGSKFSKYVLTKYAGKANFVYEPLLSVGMHTPTEERLQQIADDIAAAIGNNEYEVDVWAFSLGAVAMGNIDAKVIKKIGSDRRMDILLIDPIILDDPFGRFFVNVHVALGLPAAKFIRDGSSFIKDHRYCWINLSGGSVINVDLNLDPILFFTKLFNADRHYPWDGESELQKRTLVYVDRWLTWSLQQCYDCDRS